MACNPCVRKNVSVDCKPKADIKNIYYACKEDVLGIVYEQACNGLCTKGSISDISVNTGVDPSFGFYSIDAAISGDNKITATWSRVKNDDGSEETTQSMTLRIEGDSPDIRCVIDALVANPQDVILEYNGDDFPYELIEDFEITTHEWSSANSGRGHDITFTKTNTEQGKLIWDTDLATTQTMINNIMAA